MNGVNKGADAYILKPVNEQNLLNTIKEGLKKQEDANKSSEVKVAEFIESRVKAANELIRLCPANSRLAPLQDSLDEAGSTG